MKLAMLTALLAGAGWAQPPGTAGAISGVVLDLSDAPVAGAVVEVTRPASGTRRKTVTNREGTFSVGSLPPGDGYAVNITKNGFAAYRAASLKILLGQNVSLQVRLGLATQATSTEVSGTPIVETTKTGLSQVVESTQILNLPINGRRVDSFVLLTPAVVPDGNSGLVSFRGIAAGNLFLTDGNDTTNLFYYENAGRTRVPAQISQDAVQEFQVSASGYSAEYGRASGGVINTLTRSGSNDTHGTGYWFFRNRSLNARDPYTAYNPPESRHQTGASLGGRFRRDRLFYFFNTEVMRRKFPLVASLARPPLFDPQGRFIGTCEATGPQCAAAVRFLDRQFQVLDRTADSELGFGRLDWHPSPHQTLSASFNYLDFRSPNGERTQGVLTDGSGVGNNANTSARTRFGRLAWTAIKEPNLIFETRFGWFKDRLYDDFDNNLVSPETGRVQISVAGQGNLGVGTAFPRLDPSENRFQLAHTVRGGTGRHHWILGGDWIHTQDFRVSLENREGTYQYATFTAFAQDFNGNALSRKRWQSYSQRFGNDRQNTFVNDASLFVQDQVQWSRNLIVNLGLRYDYEHISQPSIVNPDYPQTGRIPALRNFAPRLSAAYTIDPRTVIRAGYGLFYARVQGGLINTLFLDNGLNQTAITLDGSLPRDLAAGPVFPQRLPTFDPTRAYGTSDLTYAAANYRNPYTQQADIGFERELAANLGITVSYLWSRGQRLTTVYDANIGTPGPPATFLAAGRSEPYITPTYLLSNRVNPLWRRVNVIGSEGRSFYQAIAVQMRQRLTNGFHATLAYTLSKAEDYGQGGAEQNILFNQGPRTLFNGDYQSERSRSALDQRHRLVVTSVWAPLWRPRSTFLASAVSGWQLAQISTFASSQPANPVIFVAGIPFPGAAFNTTMNGFGGSPRVPFLEPNSLDIDRVVRTDARLTKTIPLRERWKMLMSFEAFNIFNHVSNTAVSTQAYELRNRILTPTPGLGQGVASAGYPDGTNARRAQVSLRFTF